MNNATEMSWKIVQGGKEGFRLEGKTGLVWIADCHRTQQISRSYRPYVETLFAEIDADGVRTGRTIVSTVTKVVRKRMNVWFYAKYIFRDGSHVLAYVPRNEEGLQ
jgi:hypothetical protein